jgi:hypothetical protein
VADATTIDGNRRLRVTGFTCCKGCTNVMYYYMTVILHIRDLLQMLLVYASYSFCSFGNDVLASQLSIPNVRLYIYLESLY